ncbi:Lipopolysaccharide-assembly [Pedobacter westerhofensis]|uniref:Lipopolysaccharide-assembly n=1 Tax=Pedobacter westerhofensis TaxID=425512 RepID=A0A521EGW2_9SPHI|nr:LptE family protein [Pedobacter westerhofensis]SMO83169.1 Lipopolysaccharide-assembly [Pedobacter westerhofensis]
MKKIYLLLLLPLVMLVNSCSVKLNGISIPGEMKTITVLFFENNAPLVVPTLSQDFTEALKNRIRTQTRLNIVTSDAQAVFEGRITGYDIRPVALQNNNNPSAGANRLTIKVSVKYTNNINPKLSFEESFERYKDFPVGTTTFDIAQIQLIKDINVMLIEDIFNRAFAQW